MRECNPAAFAFSVPNLQNILYVNLGISIAFKFGSVVCLRLALEEYENLSSNSSYFLTAIMMSLGPSTLLAPLYTFDHYYCIPRNFLLPQFWAEELCLLALAACLIPLVVYMLLPKNLRRFYCCKRSEKVESLPLSDPAEAIRRANYEHDDSPALADFLQSHLKGLNQYYSLLVILAALVVTVLVHVF
jgi:hypothetical protein